MMELSYQSMKIANQVREADDVKTEMRKKSLLILIHHHLLGQGYMDTAAVLDQETSGSLRKFDVCDNIDLEMVLMEFESYQYVKFQKYPKLIRKTLEPDRSRSGGVKRSPCSALRRLPKINAPQSGSGSKKTAISENVSSAPPEMSDFGLNVTSIKTGTTGEVNMVQERLLKPLSGLSAMDGEMAELAAIISRDIYLHSPNVHWKDIIGLEDAKRLVKEAVVYPIKYPQLFTGIRSPWKGLLLYGPPGTGKTLLAKAVATECKTTFFNISASSIVSKWRGDSEKLVRVLFLLARYHAPSTIFLDELESVIGQRGAGMGKEHESSYRMKTELLVQMDGLVKSEDLVFVLAASNLPWELDHAMLRRLEKRILVGLPTSGARRAMISHWLPPLNSTQGVELRTELDYETLAKNTEGYSGSDIQLVCKEAAMRPVRKIFDVLESHQHETTALPDIKLETVTTADFLNVIAHTKPSARNLMDKYTAWEREYESV
ncbi:katanin p60 ATPase-containing subunit A-like 2 isoform X1 [Solea senegalensis]|uniref:Katanin p60 ATPase-containing subunit A-like 2 n=2 Tax=Solea senegalensis TaxID=28829 RepID=A0AAV6PLH2_SOLSE|nr:katanin p60 ATPase-containing subunit A-like 2 isoform X1 [Solea senegalensis]KAG7465445.1 katanin p60 ATPase-containing subunit A-like 2 isoform X1 [Solea senegalensis]